MHPDGSVGRRNVPPTNRLITAVFYGVATSASPVGGVEDGDDEVVPNATVAAFVLARLPRTSSIRRTCCQMASADASSASRFATIKSNLRTWRIVAVSRSRIRALAATWSARPAPRSATAASNAVVTRVKAADGRP